MTERAPTRLSPRLLTLTGVMLIALIACAPARAAETFVAGPTVGTANQFSYAEGLAIRPDGQILIADADPNGNKVLRFDTANALQNTASISSTLGGAGINCVAETGGTDFITTSPWDKPIRKYEENGTEIGFVNGFDMYLSSQFNGKAGPGSVECVARSGDYLYAISDRGSNSAIPSLSRWNLSDLALGPDREGTPFVGPLSGLATDSSSNLFVVDAGAHQLQSFDRDLQLRWTVAGQGTGANQLDEPSAVAVRSPVALAYVVDNGKPTPSDNRLVVFSTVDGSFVKSIKVPFDVSAITFDPANDWQPILSSGPSVYRGLFVTQAVVRITGKPRKTTKSRVASFRFASDEPDTSFTCKLDRGRAKSCRSVARFRGLSRGRHTLSVTGSVPDGLPSATVTWRWTVR